MSPEVEVDEEAEARWAQLLELEESGALTPAEFDELAARSDW